MYESLTVAVDSFDIKIGLLVFVAYVVIDGLYALYTLNVTRLNEWQSANISLTMHVLLAVGVINYTKNWLYVIPLIAGSWLGTFLTVRKQRLNKLKS